MSGTDKPPLLPLLEALVAWCDPQLVAEARAAEAPFTLAQITEAGVPHLGGAKGLGPAFRYRVQDRYKDELERATLAWHALAADFRNRLEAGEIRLVGVQVAPCRQAERSAINGLLAAEYRFSFRQNTVTGAGFRFVAVRAYRVEPTVQATDARPAAGAVADTVTVLDGARGTRIERDGSLAQRALIPGANADGPHANAQARAGRTNYSTLLEEALQANFDRIRSGRESNAMAWILVGRICIRWLAEQYPELKSHGGLPSEGTARIRLPQLYQRLIAKSDVRN